MARLLGAAQYGVYAYAYALTRILALPAQAGLPTLAVRETATYIATSDWSRLKGFLIRANQSTLIFSIVLAVLAVGIAILVGYDSNKNNFNTLCWALLLLPFVALGNLRGGVLRGLHKIIQGQLPENVIRPGLMLLLLGGIALFDRTLLTASSSMVIHVAAAVISFGIGVWMLWRCLPKEIEKVTPSYDNEKWLSSVLPLSLFSGLQMLNSQLSIIALGIYSSDSEVGIFRVVSQISVFIGFALVSVNMAIAPHIAKLHALGAVAEMQKIAKWSARSIVFITGILGLALFVFGKPLLGLSFGPEFVGGYAALVVLAAGRVMSALTGASMIFLNMTGHEKWATKSVVVAAIVNVLLNVILVPAFGIAGAAWATTLSLVLLNLIAANHVHKRVGINPWLS
jgi:O-antigen/teichoic acid export membrane protein